MNPIPTKEENPKGLHQKYVIRKVVGWRQIDFGYSRKAITKPVDPSAEYFVLRLDEHGKDPIHINACRKAVLTYAEAIKDHLPELAKDLIERYGNPLK